MQFVAYHISENANQNPLKEGLPRMIFKDYRRLSVIVFKTEIGATCPLKMDTGKILTVRRQGKN
jgi:hypothetical protein